jgi:2-hydroxychromene-2-carboxylate isomerase
MRKISFLFDFISPYAYLAWTQIHALAERNGAEVEHVPILFAALLNTLGHKGPAEIPPKRAYVFKDAYRKAHALGIAISPPASHPFNPLAALRAVTAVPNRKLIDALYRATWIEGRRVDLPEVVADIAAESGFAVEITEGVKNQLKMNTERALAAGAFGVPTMLVEGELFWGLDALPHLEQFLEGRDPVPPDAFARWGGLPATASRI